MPANRPSVGCTPGRARMFADTVAPVRIGHCGSRRWSVHPTQGTAPADFKIWGTANGARPSPPATTDLVGSGGESDTHAATANPNGYIASWTSRNGGEAYHRLAWRLTRQRFRVRARLVGRTTDFGHGADPSRLVWRAARRAAALQLARRRERKGEGVAKVALGRLAKARFGSVCVVAGTVACPETANKHSLPSEPRCDPRSIASLIWTARK